jgi:N-acetylglucosamine-6-sulfatase
MARRAARRCAAIVFALALALCGTAQARPNIVVVLADDLSWDLVSYMPNVRALQREGTTFSRYVVTNSLCCPSRASILTGRYPHSTGVIGNIPPHGGFEVFQQVEERSTFATSLKAAGYRTALLGKYLNGYTPDMYYVPPGWDVWAVAGNNYSGFNYGLMVKWPGSRARFLRYGKRPRDYHPDVMSRRGQRFIRESVAAGVPFLLELATFTPHRPFTPAPRDAKRFRGLKAPRGPLFNAPQLEGSPAWLSRARLTRSEIATIDRHYRKRAQAVQAIDKLVGDIRAQLYQLGVAGETYFIFTSDNGFHMGERRLTEGKQTAWDHDIRVPLIVAGPGVPAGATVSALAANVDLRPTLQELASVPIEPRVEGRSLVPLLRGQAVQDWRSMVLVEHRGPGNVQADPDLQGIRQGRPPTYAALRFPDALYVEYASPRFAPEYYEDPLERRNIYASLPQERKAELSELLARLRACAGPACRWADRGLEPPPWLAPHLEVR